jgi:hypothetical protein
MMPTQVKFEEDFIKHMSYNNPLSWDKIYRVRAFLFKSSSFDVTWLSLLRHKMAARIPGMNLSQPESLAAYCNPENR